jgi:hypothetical protein
MTDRNEPRNDAVRRTPRATNASVVVDRLGLLRFDLLNHLERPFEDRLLDVLRDPLKPRLVIAVGLPNTVEVGERPLVEAEGDDEVLVVLVPEMVSADRLRGPPVRFPGAPEIAVGTGLKATSRKEADH